MFQFTRFASHTYVFSVRYLSLGGFPHSEISGSKLICQLPEAYRRLSRPSSPIIAKASTTCSYSLDPITLTSPAGNLAIQASRNVCQVSHLTRYAVFNSIWNSRFKIEYSFWRNQNVADGTVRARLLVRTVSVSNADFRLYEFLKNSRELVDRRLHLSSRSSLVKNQYRNAADHLSAALRSWISGRIVYQTSYPLAPTLGFNARVQSWWRMTGSNRRPPACKAGALPAELIPQGSCARDAASGGSGWIRTNDPRLIKTVL